MKSFPFWLLLAAASGCSTMHHAAEEEAAVRAAWDRGVLAITAKNWSSYSTFWAHKPYVQILHPAAGEWLKGWSEIGPRYRSLLASDIELTGETRRFDVQIAPSGDFAWATIEVDFTIDGTSHTAWQVAIFEKIAGEWRLVLGFDAPAETQYASGTARPD